MKCRIDKKDVLKFFSDKGKEYSKVAKEVEQNFRNWLDASMMGEADFLNYCNSRYFRLSYDFDGTEAVISLENGGGEFALPLIWDKKSGIALNDFKSDASLLLLYVANKCSNEISVKTIKSFVKKNLSIDK